MSASITKQDFVARVMEELGGKGSNCINFLEFFNIEKTGILKIKNFLMAGVDVILDSVGASYLQQDLDSLNIDGRLFIIGSLSGFVAEVKIGAMVANLLGNFGLTNQ